MEENCWRVSVSFYPSLLVFRRDKWALISRQNVWRHEKETHPKTVGLNLSYAVPNYDWSLVHMRSFPFSKKCPQSTWSLSHPLPPLCGPAWNHIRKCICPVSGGGAVAMPRQRTRVLAISPNINVEKHDQKKKMVTIASARARKRAYARSQEWVELKMDTNKTYPPLLVRLARSGAWH